MKNLCISVRICTLLFLGCAVQTAIADSGRVTGFQIPRCVSLNSDEVNVRVGPGFGYDIRWVYEMHGLPVSVQDEYDVWRLIEDPEGQGGWLHQAMISGRRTVLTRSNETAIYEHGYTGARVVGTVAKDVVFDLGECADGYCQVDHRGLYSGWINKTAVWGAQEEECGMG